MFSKNLLGFFVLYFTFLFFHFLQKQDILFFQKRVHGGEAPEKDVFKEPLIDFSFFKETTKIDLLFYKILK
jgi:hypothetical protein